MSYNKNLIKQIYLELENLENFDFLKIEPSEECYIYRCIDQLDYKYFVESDVTYKLGHLCTRAFEEAGVKGFLAGIYFALKLSEVYKEDFEKILEFINLYDK
ncbi:MAG: hypothetical protein Q4D26_01485 [Clostridia bacterium]|nr:hypothetical protein [Clostridia bacterium]